MGELKNKINFYRYISILYYITYKVYDIFLDNNNDKKNNTLNTI